MEYHDELKKMLKDLIPCIKGRWLLISGALLGLTRNKDLIPWDEDLDLNIFEENELEVYVKGSINPILPGGYNVPQMCS